MITVQVKKTSQTSETFNPHLGVEMRSIYGHHMIKNKWTSHDQTDLITYYESLHSFFIGSTDKINHNLFFTIITCFYDFFEQQIVIVGGTIFGILHYVGSYFLTNL